MEEKTLLREKHIAARKALPPDEKKARDKRIVEKLLSSRAFKGAEAVLLYYPIKEEIDLRPIIRACREAGKPVALPKCKGDEMAFYVLEPNTLCVKGAYGIPEPPEGAPLFVPNHKTLCITPGLSFDLRGGRLGYGKGYYDRFLKNFPGVAVGAVYEDMIETELPAEEHDFPVRFLFTDAREIDCKNPEPLQKANKKRKLPTANEFLSLSKAKLAAFWEFLKLGARGEGGVRPLHTPPVLVLCTFLLLWFARLCEALWITKANEYVLVILLQLLIFSLPAVLYAFLCGKKFYRRLRLRPFRPRSLWFLGCMLAVMITGGLLTSILTGGIASLDGRFTLYSTFTAHLSGNVGEMIYVILAYAVLPAIGEEAVYRGILSAQYERFGVGVSVAVSSLFFAMLHFSFAHFITYFCLGVLLSLAMYTTRSLISPILLHLAYNLFCLFGQPYLSAFYVRAGSHEIFIFCVAVLCLLFAAFAAGEARKAYHIYAKEGKDSSYTVAMPLSELPKRALVAVLTPVAGICFALWLIGSIIDLF